MSTQGSSGIPFSICNEQQGVRLLELPPALLSLITSEHPPNLSLKSAALNAVHGSRPIPGYAMLCTDDHTYHVRQVNSSNSVFLLQTSEDGMNLEEDAIPTAGLSAIAQCTATLELLPTTPSGLRFLTQILPVYDGLEVREENGVGLPKTSKVTGSTSKNVLLENVPFSPGEFKHAWMKLRAFEVQGQAYLPSALALVHVWKSLVSVAALRSVDLEQRFPLSKLVVLAEEDGHPGALSTAVIQRLCSEHEDVVDGCVVLSREHCTPWVGITLLESHQAFNEGYMVSVFLQEWQNLLPEGWRRDASLSTIKGKFAQPSKGMIVFEDLDEGINVPAAPASINSKGPRKWHEKFKIYH